MHRTPKMLRNWKIIQIVIAATSQFVSFSETVNKDYVCLNAYIMAPGKRKAISLDAVLFVILVRGNWDWIVFFDAFSNSWQTNLVWI